MDTALYCPLCIDENGYALQDLLHSPLTPTSLGPYDYYMMGKHSTQGATGRIHRQKRPETLENNRKRTQVAVGYGIQDPPGASSSHSRGLELTRVTSVSGVGNARSNASERAFDLVKAANRAASLVKNVWSNESVAAFCEMGTLLISMSGQHQWQAMES